MKITRLINRVVAVGMLAAAATISGAALARPITLNFSGTVTQTSFDPFDPWAGAVGVGSDFYAYLHFDDDAVDAASSPHLGAYTLSGFPFGLVAVVGPVLVPQMDTVSIAIVDAVGGGSDQYSVFASEGAAGGLGDHFSLSMLFEDESGTALSGDALPSTVPDLNRFSTKTFTLFGQYTDTEGALIQYEVQGNVLPMPAPGAAELACLALLGCALASRRLPPRPRSRQPLRRTPAAPAASAHRPAQRSPPQPVGRADGLSKESDMNTGRYRRLLALALAAIGLVSAPAAHAVDGVILIDQTRALSGGVTPGDAPGFPVTISRSGSYRLASNLTVTPANTSAIVVEAGGDAVTLDLNGFSIVGPCKPPAACAASGSGFGVFGATIVTNGSVIGMGGSGVVGGMVKDVWAGQNGSGVAADVVTRVRAHQNRGTGISSKNVTQSVATENLGQGIAVINGTVTSSTANRNGGDGFYVVGSTISNCTAELNGSLGISGDSAKVMDNTVNGNQIGIFLVGGTASGNVVFANRGYGINVANGALMGNTVFSNAGVGLVFRGGAVGYGANTVFGNSGGEISGVGVQIGTNVCGSGLCP
jgi:hypothetical protein